MSFLQPYSDKVICFMLILFAANRFCRRRSLHLCVLQGFVRLWS